MKRFLLKLLRPLIAEAVKDARLRTPLVFGSKKRLKIHPEASVQNALFNLSSGTITVEEGVFFGHNVSVLTGSHDISQRGRKRRKAVAREGCDIVIRRGAWISSNCTIVGPCDIGEDAVVAAGAVVTRDVPAGTLVGGNPAKVIREIAFDHAES